MSQNNIRLRQQLQKLIDFIEDHLEEDLSLEALSMVVGYSPFHLHHIFTAFTGESLAGYIRKRSYRKPCAKFKVRI